MGKQRYTEEPASACSRSAQSTSTSSSPTERRSSPCGMRSPSQRCRDSSFVRVPPRLVAFSIDASGARPARGVAVRDVEGDQDREARDSAPSRTAGCAPRRSTRIARPSPPAGRAAPRASSARGEQPGRVGRGDDARRRRVRCRRACRSSSRTATDAGEQIVVAAEALGRASGATTSQPCVERAQADAAWRRSRRRRPGPGGRAAASKSGIVSSGFGGRLDPDQVGAGGGRAVWSNSTSRTPQRREMLEQLGGDRSRRPPRARSSRPGGSSVSRTVVTAPMPEGKSSARRRRAPRAAPRRRRRSGGRARA